jgi:hypothetical protein
VLFRFGGGGAAEAGGGHGGAAHAGGSGDELQQVEGNIFMAAGAKARGNRCIHCQVSNMRMLPEGRARSQPGVAQPGVAQPAGG